MANLAGFGSFWALGDHNQPAWAHGTISRYRLKLHHQPWALWIWGEGTVAKLPMLGQRVVLALRGEEVRSTYSPLN